jgi:hypothetical protein
MLSILSLAAAVLQPAGPPSWTEFDRRPSGWAPSPYEYDTRSVRRRGARVRATYRYTIFTSGVPNYRYRIRLEIDCARRRARALEALLYGGIYELAGTQPRRERTPTIATPIVAGSAEEALARRLCPRLFQARE